MEQDTAAAAVGRDPDDEHNAHDSSSKTGKKADEDQQILLAIGDTNWYRSTQALKYLQPIFMLIVMNEMKRLQLQSMTDFGRQLCAEATVDDIRPVNGWLAQFKHLCPGTVVACQNLLNIIKGHTSDFVNFYQMLKGTDPQQWLNSPFEFVRLFLKDWMRCDIHDFQECDITALCTIVKRCKPLMKIFDERKIDELRKVRNRTMHPATMSISQEDMENNIDVILDFLEHIKSLKSTDEVNEAIESIKQLRKGDVRLLHSMVVRLIQGWLPAARIAYEHKSEQAKNQLQDIMYMEAILATLSSGQEITQSAGLEFGAKKEEYRESENLNELKELKERLQIKEEVIRELEEQNKKLHKEKRKLEKQNEKLLRLEPPKSTASGGESFPTQALSASTSSGDEHGTVKEDFSKPEPPYESPRTTLSALERLGAEHETVKEEFSITQPLFHSPRMTSPTLEKLHLGSTPATGSTDESTVPVKSDTDKRRCYITGMVAISRTQLVLADKSNKCIKLLDLERGTVIGVKELKSAPQDVTCVPGSRVAVTIPAVHKIHVFTADENLEHCRTMNVDGDFLGIHCTGDIFFVACKKPQVVKILNMEGDVIEKIQLAPIEYPLYLTCSPDNKFIYVSDYYHDNVTCMDMAGSVQWTYNCRPSESADEKLRQGVCTGDGCIYICSSNEIHVVSPTGTKLAGIPIDLKGARSATVCYSSQERTLYVSQYPFAGENGCISRIRMH